MKAIVRYQCPVCNRSYDTPEEAERCYKSPRGRFKVGDIVWNGELGSVYRIEYVDPIDSPAVDGASVIPVMSLRAAAKMVPAKNESVWLVGSFWCRAELFPGEEALKLERELAARLNLARRFRAEVEACHKAHRNTEEASA